MVSNIADQLTVPYADFDPDYGSGDVTLGIQLAKVQELISNDQGMAFILCTKYFSFSNWLFFILSHTSICLYKSIFMKSLLVTDLMKLIVP